MRITIIGLILMCSILAHGQGLTSEGREFYLGHIHGTHTDVASAFAWSQQRVYAIVSSYEDNEIYVSYFNPQTGVETQPNKYNIATHGSAQFLLDDILMRSTEPGDIAEYRSCHIVAKHPVSVQYYRSGSGVTGGYLALPVGTWGKEYVVASDPDNPGYGGWAFPPDIPSIDNSNGCFMVIAAMNNTTVTILPNAQTGGGHTGATQGQGSTGVPQPYTITLHRGQSYLVKSVSALIGNVDDISGSIVKADKPIAVITAHENANVGDGMVLESHQTDARDFLIEQAIPWEYATNDSIYSIPMQDSKGILQGGYGEDIRFYVSDANAASSVTIKNCSGSESTLGVSPYAVPPATNTNVTQPLHYSCESGKRFQAVQYELRSDGEGKPYPAPAMMNLIPKQSWRNSYLWHIPTKPLAPGGLQPYEEYYVTIIGDPDVTPALKTAVKTWNCAPLGWLRATTYKINSGVTYYAHSTRPFMAYVFGYVGTRDLPLPDDQWMTYGGFAFPAGMRGRMGGKANIDTNIESSCSSWNICATDKNGAGIKSIALLKDADNFFTTNELAWPDIIQGDLAYRNCAIANATSLDGQEILKLMPEQSMCANIQIIDSTQDAYAPLAITDANGNIRIIELSYDASQLTTDSIFTGFTKVRVGDTAQKSVVIRSKNLFQVNSISLSDTSVFSFQTNKNLPYYLRAGDSIVINVSFAPKDTLPQSGKLTFSNECMSVDQPFSAKGATALIYAEDRDFGSIVYPSTRCRDIRVDNKGAVPYRILSMTMMNSLEFAFDSAEAGRLPITVNPGSYINIGVCYQPKDGSADTATILWGTDINMPYANSIKTTSALYGRGVQQSVESDEPGALSIRPNPNNGKCKLDLTALESKRVSITVFTMLGAECYQTNAFGGEQVELQLSELPSGTYTVRVEADGEVYDLRLVIQ